MLIKSQNTTLESTGQDFDLNINKIKNLTSVLITPSDFEFLETDLQDEDALFGHFVDLNILPLHNVHATEIQSKQPTYYDSEQDFTYQTYPGKDLFKLKYNWRLDYHQLVQQFEGEDLRVIFVFENRYFLTTQNGANVRGFKLSNVTLEDIEILASNLSPLKIELADKSERKSEVLTYAGYPVSRIDRRFLNITATATDSSLSLGVEYLGTAITTLIASDIYVIDDYHGSLTYNLTGTYILDNFKSGGVPVTLTGGCVKIYSEAYIGKQKYTVVAVVTYANFILQSGDNFTLQSGDNFIFTNTI